MELPPSLLEGSTIHLCLGHRHLVQAESFEGYRIPWAADAAAGAAAAAEKLAFLAGLGFAAAAATATVDEADG